MGGEKKKTIYVYLNLDLCLSVKREEEWDLLIIFTVNFVQILFIFAWVSWTKAGVSALRFHSGSIMCVRQCMTFSLAEWKINIAWYVEVIHYYKEPHQHDHHLLLCLNLMRKLVQLRSQSENNKGITAMS